MSKDRKPIYVAPPLKEALEGRSESLSTRVNGIAERYMALRTYIGKGWVHFSDLERSVIASAVKDFRRKNGRVMMSHEIASLHVIVEAWIASQDPTHDMYMAGHAVKRLSYPERLVLVEELERT